MTLLGYSIGHDSDCFDQQVRDATSPWLFKVNLVCLGPGGFEGHGFSEAEPCH